MQKITHALTPTGNTVIMHAKCSPRNDRHVLTIATDKGVLLHSTRSKSYARAF